MIIRVMSYFYYNKMIISNLRNAVLIGCISMPLQRFLGHFTDYH